MDKRRLLIVDSSEDFAQAVSQELEDRYQVSCCLDGMEALSHIRSHRPDILLLEPMIPRLDGISLLQILRSEGICPVVLMVTRYYNEYILYMLSQLNVGYFMQKPCELNALVARLQDLDQQSQISMPPHPRLILNPESLMIKLGFSPKHLGYKYLLTAIDIYLLNPEISTTKELYPTVAARHNVEQANVEHAIRTAIEAAWKRGNAENWNALLPECGRSRPTNSTFILRITQKLREYP